MAFACSSVPLPVTPSALLAESPASTRRDIGFTMFRSNSIGWFSPCLYTGSRSCPYARTLKAGNLTVCLLARAYQHLWLLEIDDACGSSPELGLPSGLALRPPRCWQSRRLPRGRLLARRSGGTLSRQLLTQPLPAAPVPIDHCGRNRRSCSCSFHVIQLLERLHVAPSRTSSIGVLEVYAWRRAEYWVDCTNLSGQAIAVTR